MRVVFAAQLAGLFVERDKAGCIGVWNVHVGPVLAVGSAGVNQIIDHQQRTVGSVVGKDAQFIQHVVLPKDIRVFGSNLGFGFARASDVLGFVREWPGLGVGQTFGVAAEDFAAAGH